MAIPINFTPGPVDHKAVLKRRLDAAPAQHAEALLAAYDLLEEAHRQGVLDTLRGAVGAKDTIAGILAQCLAEPASTNSLRNLLAVGKLLGSLDPERRASLSVDLARTIESHGEEQQPPTLWEIFKRIRQPEAHRGLSLLTSIMAALGRTANQAPRPKVEP